MKIYSTYTKRGSPNPRRFDPVCILPIIMCLAFVGSLLVTAPAAAQQPDPTLTLQTMDGTVRDDSVISTGTMMTASVGGVLETGDGQRELRIDLDDATIYKAGGVTAPEGWTVEWSTDDGATWVAVEPGVPADVTNVRASASVNAGIIDGTSQIYAEDVTAPVPVSTFSGSTGGDGWDVFFYDDYVLNIYHHQSSQIALDCHLRSTGARCDGFDPTQTTGAAASRFDGYMSANRSGGWVDGENGKAYAFTADNNSGSATQYQPGVLCIDLDVSPPANCGFTPLSSNANISTYTPLANAEGIGGRLFGMESENQQLLCFDPDTNAPCVGSPVQLAGATNTNQYHVYALGDKVFASTDSTLYCFESSDLSDCGGEWPVTYISLSWTAQNISPVAHMDTSGTIDGICMWNGCLDLAGAEQTVWVNPHSVTPWAADASQNSWSGQYGKFTATAGRAYLQRVLSTNEVYCFDYATEAACVGFNTTPTTDIYLYALVVDPNNPGCIWYNSDQRKIGLFDALTGVNECTANPVITLQPSVFAPRFVCTTSGGIDRWTSLQLTSVAGGTSASQTLTVRTADGDAIEGWIDRPIAIGEVLSLADLSVDDSGARPTFNISFAGVTGGALTSADFTILYEGRGPELCVDFVVDNTAADGSPNCPAIQDITGTMTQNVTSEVVQSAPPRTFIASGSDIECPENILFAGPPGPVQELVVDVSTPFEVDVCFRTPADDGGSPIRWFEFSADGGVTWTIFNGTPDSDGVFCIPIGSLDATSHTFDVRAINLIGDGPTTAVTGQVTDSVASPPPTTTATGSGASGSEASGSGASNGSGGTDGASGTGSLARTGNSMLYTYLGLGAVIAGGAVVGVVRFVRPAAAPKKEYE